MISYKQYKLLNESLGQTFTLGVRSIPTIGIVGANDIEKTLEEAKKKCSMCKKKMNGDEEPAEDEPDAEDKVDRKLGKKDEPEDKEPEDKEEPEEEGDEPKEKEPEAKEEPEEEPEEKPTLFQKKQKAKQKKKMTKEDAEFFKSLASQLGTDLNQKNWDGISPLDEKTKRAGISDNYPPAYVRDQYPDGYYPPISANAPGKLAGKMGS